MALSFSGRSSVIRAIDPVCSNKTKRGSALTAMCSGLLLVNHPLRAEHVVLVIAQPQELLKDVGVVLAQARWVAEHLGGLDTRGRGDGVCLQAFGGLLRPPRPRPASDGLINQVVFSPTPF